MLDLKQFENPYKNFYILKKWDWDYVEAESFQQECLVFVNKNPHVSILIICSHNSCFTLGRGLQKLKDNSEIQLIDFDNEVELKYPLQYIKRGGGLTFHYPGQFVFYPIINLTFHKVGVHDFMSMIMDLSKSLLEEMFNLYHFKKRNDLLGLWFDNSFALAKVASIGFAVSKFNTYHGMALNFLYDKEMFEALKKLHPCGIPGNIYLDIESIYQKGLTLDDREIFATNFEKLIILKLVEQKLSREDCLLENSV